MLSSACIYLATVKLFACCLGASVFQYKSRLDLNDSNNFASLVPMTPLSKPSTEDESRLSKNLETRVADT